MLSTGYSISCDFKRIAIQTVAASKQVRPLTAMPRNEHCRAQGWLSENSWREIWLGWNLPTKFESTPENSH
jgi:hypothetical protein